MPEYTLADVELTGEFRAPRENELYWNIAMNRVEPCPDSDRTEARIIFRPIVGTWSWACQQMLFEKKVRRESWGARVNCIEMSKGGWIRWMRGDRYHLRRDDMTATDWQIYEPKPQTWDDWMGASLSDKKLLVDHLKDEFPPPSLIRRIVEAVISLPGSCTVPPNFVLLMEEARRWQESHKCSPE